MSKCRQCNVTILDPTMVCPLCNSVLEKTDQGERIIGMYPDVKETTRKINYVVRLLLFFTIVLESVLIIINYLTYSGMWWSAITGVVILYFYMTLKFTIQNNTGFHTVILTQTAGAVVLTFCIDLIVGYRGWSLNIALPCGILFLDLAILFMMILNMKNWQSYILLQLVSLGFCIVDFVLWRLDKVTYPIIGFVAAGMSVVLFAGTLIFGDRKVKNELKRRFHV